MSYEAKIMLNKHISYKSPVFKKRKKKKYLRNFILFVFVVVIFIVALSTIFSLKYFLITDIFISGNVSVNTDDLKNFVFQNIDGKYFKLFSQSNFLLYPKGKIEKNILENWKQIEKVKLLMSGFNSLNIIIIERKPFALWCQKFTEMNANDCYLMNNEGYIFLKSPEYSGNVFVRYFGERTDGEIMGSSYLNFERFKKIVSFVLSLEKLKINSNDVIFQKPDYEIILSDKSRIILSENNDMEKTFQNLDSFLKDNSLNVSIKNFLMSVDYIDLRFGNKIYHKLK